MSEGYVIYVCDTETTGLLPAENDVIEISMARLIPKNDGTHQEDQKTWCVKAMNPKTISDEALSVNGHKREDILCVSKYGKETYRLPNIVIDEIEAWMSEDNVSSMDRVFAGQNPNFDIQMLQEMWKKAGHVGEENFPFFVSKGNRTIDLKQIILLFDICTGRRRKFYNLGSFVKSLGVKKGKAHQAAEDVRMTKDAFLKLFQMIQMTVKEQFANCYSNDE